MDWNDYLRPEIVRLLGQRYREYRLHVGLTQKEVDDKSNVTATTIHKFESGASTIVFAEHPRKQEWLEKQRRYNEQTGDCNRIITEIIEMLASAE